MMELDGLESKNVVGRKTRAVIDLESIRHNVRQLRQATDADIAAVVKANAYGHGSVEVAKAALDAGASVLAVAMAEEAVPLRQAGIDNPILVIGPSNAAQTDLGVQLNLDLSVSTEEALYALEEAAAAAGTAGRMHLKVDTGMGRTGVREQDELENLLRQLDRSEHVELAGMFTHFARADEYDTPAHTAAQMERFMDAADKVRARGYSPVLHAANSAASQSLPEADLDMVRFGISMYGYPAGDGKPGRQLDLQPAMRVDAEVSVVRDIPEGTPISYGGTFVTDRPSRIATVQIGYGDGYNRLLSNTGKMIVSSGDSAVLAPVVGRVCMDMTMIDVTDCPDVRPGDLVTAMGEAGDVHWNAQDIADACGTISYEVLCDYGQRIPRVYEN